MIAVVRIRGLVDVPKEIEETLNRLRLRKKFSCIVVQENKVVEGMIKKVRNYVAYGKINKDTLKKIIEKRAKPIDKKKKIDVESAVEEIFNGNKKFEELNIKPFFRLHPPRGGLKSIKKHFPKGALGDHGEKINDLIERML